MSNDPLEATGSVASVNTREVEASNPHVVRQTLVGAQLVSTISLDSPTIQAIDGVLGSMGTLIGSERADLSTPGNFETMVFDADESGSVTDWMERDFRRYDTRADAEAGHAEVVAAWEAKQS